MGEAILARNASGGGGGEQIIFIKDKFNGTNGRVFSIYIDAEPREVHIWLEESTGNIVYGINELFWDADASRKILRISEGDYSLYDNKGGQAIFNVSYSNGLFTLEIASGFGGSYGFRSGRVYNYTVIA